MSVKKIKILVVLLLVTGFGLTGYLWYQNRQLDKHNLYLSEELDTALKKNKALSKKYAQEKAKLATAMRVQMAEQSRNQKLQKELNNLTAERDDLAEKLTVIETKFEARIEKYKTRIEKFKTAREEMLAALETLREKFRNTVREKNEKISLLTSERDELSSDLKMTESSLARSNKHNTKLCKIAEELTQKYREKSGNGDPFTKLKMVEVEHLIQEYIKQIDKERIIAQ